MDFLEILHKGFALVVMVLFFGGSIFVHELGHFLAAKWRGLKVVRFSIGFGPKLFAWKGKDACEYRVSLLPLGGYVALPQLADMGRLEGGSQEDDDLLRDVEKLPKISYFDKVVVAGAGAFFNVLFALVIAAVVWFCGVPVPASNSGTVIGYVPKTIYADDGGIPSPAFAAGLKEGDEVLQVDSSKVSEFTDIAEAVAMGTGRSKDGKPECTVKILRDKKEMELTLNPALVRTNSRSGDFIRMIGVYPKTSLKVSQVMPNSPAQKAGLKEGDIILEIDGQRVYSNYQVSDYISKKAGKKLAITVLRGDEKIEMSATAQKIMLTRPSVEIAGAGGEKMTIFCKTYNDSEKFDASAKGTLVVLDAFDSDSIKEGEILLKVGSNEVSSLTDFAKLLNLKTKTSSVVLRFSDLRGTSFSSLAVPSGFSARIVDPQSKYMLGYSILDEKVISHPSVAKQFSDNLWRTWGALKSLFSPSSDIGLKHLTGPIGIGRVMYRFTLVDFTLVLSFVVLININLAILNLLPIPVLDGGHILFATISKIMRRPLPIGIVAALQGFFMIFFLGVMAYVIYFDVIRWRGDSADESQGEAVESFYITDINFKK